MKESLVNQLVGQYSRPLRASASRSQAGSADDDGVSVESWSLVAQMVAALVAAIAAVAAWRAANASRDAIRAEHDECRQSILSDIHAVLAVLLADLEAGNFGAFLEHRRALDRLHPLHGTAIRGIGDLSGTETTNIDQLTNAVKDALHLVAAEIGYVTWRPPGPPPWWRLIERPRWRKTHPFPLPLPVGASAQAAAIKPRTSSFRLRPWPTTWPT